MTENVPPSTAPSAPGTTAATGPGAAGQAPPTRGVPYYEKLRKELRDTLQKKRLLDRNLATLEESIYRFEQSYLEETGAGNIIKGFDNYIKGSAGASSLGAAGGLGSSFAVAPLERAAEGPQREGKHKYRVFSQSSASFMRDSPAPSSAHTTPSHAPTPTYSGSSGKADRDAKDSSAPNSVKGAASKNKKKSAGAAREREDDDDGGETKPPVKRLKITYGRGD
uniref:Chromatin modification-related protein EAF6 n=1 Tax=Coccidioides posadasii RMSCC 3488 TaxID=454284 RepID=A0A0J6F9D8_COCPO|nr:hypothetical protein CPAG_05926 [Coccidioides posadasii RMSCC 3488]